MTQLDAVMNSAREVRLWLLRHPVVATNTKVFVTEVTMCH